MAEQPWLVAGGALSAVASALHIGCIFGGADWYRFLGAGERMAMLAERGAPGPTLITLGIAAVLALWSAYAFAGAGLVPRLPLMKLALVTISAIYLARGLVLVPALIGGWPTFWIASSLVVLGYGLVYAIGTWHAWSRL